MSNEFERMMQPEAWGGGGADARRSVHRVADTVYLCRVWWEAYGGDLKPTPTDLLTMARMILREERKTAVGR